MKALTLRPQWAWFVVSGYGDIKSSTLPQPQPPLRRIWIHAGSSPVTNAEYEQFEKICHDQTINNYPKREKLKTGGIVGSVKIEDGVECSTPFWFDGPVKFVLRKARKTRFKPMKGKPGLFDATPSDAEIKESVRQAQGTVLSEMRLETEPVESKDVVVVSTRFEVGNKSATAAPQHHQLTPQAKGLLQESVRMLRFGGLLFVYGNPRDLVFFAEHLSLMRDSTQRMVFKYWIALDIDNAPRGNFLKPSHQGLLMYVKSKPGKMKTKPGKKTASPFLFNNLDVRTPHLKCSSCPKFLKDWGGKTKNMDADGTVFSDVWRDLPRRRIQDCAIPADVLERIHALTMFSGVSYQHIVQQSPSIEIAAPNGPEPPGPQQPMENTQWENMARVEPNSIQCGDCVSFLKRVKTLYPEGVFDMEFVDPPYNLDKEYTECKDEISEPDYIERYNTWLQEMIATLEPGGSLFMLTLPEWAIHHAVFLNRRLEFRHWIVWDATGEPLGKLTPSHYALLYYTKPGGNPTFNYAPLGSPAGEECVLPADAPKYCLRKKCLKRRKRLRDDDKVELSDVWFDIQRIKHKRDRDKHPCQLPEKLMERLVQLTTRRGERVFDPCCGAGTTAIAAAKLGRIYVMVDIDSKYVGVAESNLAAGNEHFREHGVWKVPRKTVPKNPNGSSSKEL